jgi:hypothetical protein
MHVPSQPLDAITAFAVPNPNFSSQSRRFFQVWLSCRLPRLTDHPVYLGQQVLFRCPFRGLPPKLHSRTRIFKGRRKCSGPRKNRAALCRHRPYLRANLFHGLERLKKKRQLSPGLPPTSPCWIALPHWLPKKQSRCAGSGILTRFPFAQLYGVTLVLRTD